MTIPFYIEGYLAYYVEARNESEGRKKVARWIEDGNLPLNNGEIYFDLTDAHPQVEEIIK